MENNINLDAHSSLIIADGSIVEINGQKVLLTLLKEEKIEDKPKIDLHNDSWCVWNDGSQRFKDTVVKWMNEKIEIPFMGSGDGYYGIDKEKQFNFWNEKDIFTHILTLDEFCALAYPQKEGSELVGKWLRYKKEGFDITNKWFEIKNVNPACGMYENSTNALTVDGEHAPYGDSCFDLSNPLDYNPETLVGKYYNGHKIESIAFPTNSNKPHFYLGEDLHIECADITPSDVTDEPPVKSLKYEDCFERVKPRFFVFSNLTIARVLDNHKNNVPTERQAKQLAATIKLMVIMKDANGGEWIPSEQESIVVPVLVRRNKECYFDVLKHSNNSPIYFRDRETAERAYEANKDIFHAYFGINE